MNLEEPRDSDGNLKFRMRTYKSYSYKPKNEIETEMKEKGFSKAESFVHSGDYFYEVPITRTWDFFRNYEVSGTVFYK